MKDNNRIALSGHAAKWIDLYSTFRDEWPQHLVQAGLYSWTYAEWHENFPEAREQMQADYDRTVEFIKDCMGI